MSTMFEKVREFHKAFDCAISDVPTTGDEKLRCLRIKLIEEERWEVHGELFPTIDDERPGRINLPALAKELCDLLYVTLGTGVSLGLDLDKCFAEVHRSNMSKLLPNGSVLRRADGKVLKGPNYSPADIESVLYPKEP